MASGSDGAAEKRDQKVPSQTMPAKTIFYVDGSCSGNGKGDAARAGIGVFHSADSKYNLSEALPTDFGPATNQKAELYAGIRALETFRPDAEKNPGSELELRSDSIYLVKGMNEWMANWKRNNWMHGTFDHKKKRSGQKKTIANVELWKRLDELATGYPCRITWVHVRGHMTDHGNEMADKLATAASAVTLKSNPRKKPDDDEPPKKVRRVSDDTDSTIHDGIVK